MTRNYEIMKNINDKLMKNSYSEVTIDLKNLTLLDIFALINTVKIRDKL